MSVHGTGHAPKARHARLACILALLLLQGEAWINPRTAHAMGPEHVASLPGADLLDQRVDAVLRMCGLPVTVDDDADRTVKRQSLRWGEARMDLSAQPWTIRYSRSPAKDHPGHGWRNPEAGSTSCLADLSEIVLQAKGEAGFLTAKKRPDGNGYTTTYTVPDDLFTAHQVVGINGRWQQGRSASELRQAYGPPDEILRQSDGTSLYRYWIVHRENKMPLSARAVDFEIAAPEKVCHQYAVYTTGTGFVQEKLDALIRQWERVYVLD